MNIRSRTAKSGPQRVNSYTITKLSRLSHDSDRCLGSSSASFQPAANRAHNRSMSNAATEYLQKYRNNGIWCRKQLKIGREKIERLRSTSDHAAAINAVCPFPRRCIRKRFHDAHRPLVGLFNALRYETDRHTTVTANYTNLAELYERHAAR